MKKRIITAVVLLPLLLAIVLFLPKVFTSILFGLMAAIAAYELLYNTGLVRHPRLVIYSMVMALLVALWSHFGCSQTWATIGLLVFTTALFGEMMGSHIKLTFGKIALCYVAGLLIPYLFTSIIRIHGTVNGRYLVLIPFAMAMLGDTGAYFAGRAFGSHKLAPVISPKKTVEGVAGGLLAAMVGMMIYALVLQLAFDFEVNYVYAMIYGLVGAGAGVFGDLCFSVIKRQTGIKDYGSIIPGHGGILDRFDSTMIVGPLAEVLLLLIPMAV